MLLPCDDVVIVMLIVEFYSDPSRLVLSSSFCHNSLGEGLNGVLAVVMLIVVIFIVTLHPVSCSRHLLSHHHLLGLEMDGVRSGRHLMSSISMSRAAVPQQQP